MARGPGSYAPGGDAQAIARIANRYFGSFKNLFVAHGWPERGETMMTVAPARIVAEYGSIKTFEGAYSEAHPPMEAIYSDPPNVWLTSFYGFGPEEWGFLGFTQAHQRVTFIRGSKPGVLVVVYGATGASPLEAGRIIGIQQCSHETNSAREFMSPAAWAAKERDPEARNKWNHAVKAVRAWRVVGATPTMVREFAPEATAREAWQYIGAQGARLSRSEALNILKLDLQETDVYGASAILASASGSAREILAPSKAGPVSQTPYTVRESEGPKHLYILKLVGGDIDAFLGEPANGHTLVKAGFSRSPTGRCSDFNRALPKCAFRWEVMHSGANENLDPYPSSDHAKAGERKMQEVLCHTPRGQSLGGEFFLAERSLIEQAWREGNRAAKDFKK